jgi:hypothetical protein
VRRTCVAGWMAHERVGWTGVLQHALHRLPWVRSEPESEREEEERAEEEEKHDEEKRGVRQGVAHACLWWRSQVSCGRVRA